jgi:hypothetical protein
MIEEEQSKVRSEYESRFRELERERVAIQDDKAKARACSTCAWHLHALHQSVLRCMSRHIIAAASWSMSATQPGSCLLFVVCLAGPPLKGALAALSNV